MASANTAYGSPPRRGPRMGGLPDRYVKWLLMAPLLLLLFMSLYPTLSALYMSFHQWEGTMIERPFVGLENYHRLLTNDDRFANGMTVTLIIEVAALSLQMGLGLSLALLFSGEFWGKRVLTTVFLVPVMISPVVVGFTARMAFTNQYGFVSQIIDAIVRTETGIAWLSDPFWAKVVIIVADVWQWTPFVFLICLSGLASLPQEPYEAAQVDGANAWQAFWHVTLPQMRYILLVALLIRGLDLLKLFDVVMLATRGGPGTATETISVYIYNLAFRFWSFGYAAAASFLLLIVVLVIATFLIRMIGGTSEE
ncbi:MAG: sugar ABC transporter permease [Ardenticatenia bacterium]|nr:sugar ABC transporter permease [Ardenticatenia bacterium]